MACMYTTYGYILIAKDIYNIKNFVKNNYDAFQAIEDFQSNDPKGNSSMSYEYDDNHRILMPFTFFGETMAEKDKVFTDAINVIKKFFPSYQILLKVNLKDADDNKTFKTFFNDATYDYLNNWREVQYEE